MAYPFRILTGMGCLIFAICAFALSIITGMIFRLETYRVQT
jgi:hypothetical protein